MDHRTDTKEPETAKQLRARIKALHKLGVRNAQLRRILNLSYTGMSRLATGEIQPASERLPDYHRRITDWVRKVASV